MEAIKETSTLSELGQKYELAPTQIRTWKKQFLESAEDIFEKPLSNKTEEEKEKDKLLRFCISEPFKLKK